MKKDGWKPVTELSETECRKCHNKAYIVGIYYDTDREWVYYLCKECNFVTYFSYQENIRTGPSLTAENRFKSDAVEIFEDFYANHYEVWLSKW